MQITRQADYALRAILYLARLDTENLISTRKIAEDMLIPTSFLAKIISQLSNAGLIHTSRGTHGGVSLAKPTSDISMHDIVTAIDGSVHLNECTREDCECPFGETCPIHEVWLEAETLLIGKLVKTTVNDLLKRKK
ncbi:MAG: Rrf2 family transcriptional regulator [Anaerolineaceae bacterium]|nr:Rrf2 family transcriptional regulator [Anaerolineaceae bacterium]